MIEGYCDVVTPERIQGWVFDRSLPETRQELELLMNGRVVQTIVADQFRIDLAHDGIGDGCHAFQVLIPLAATADGREMLEIGLRIVATGELMPGSALTVSLEEAPLTYLQLRCLPDRLLDIRMAKGLERAHGVCRQRRGELDRPAKIALYAINAQIVLASHRKTIAELKAAGYAVVVVNSDEHFGGAWLNLAGDCVDAVVLKRDEGRDFSSWLTAYHLYRAELDEAEHVLFINESLCGPFRPLAPLLDRGAQSPAGFWALSDSYDVRYHLQSSLFILSQQTVRSRPFREFVAGYAYPNEKRAVIDQGEIALSTCLISGGISTDVLCRYEELCDRWMAKYDVHLEEVCQLSCFSADDQRFAESQQPWLVNGYVEHWTRWIQNLAGSLLAGEPRNAQHVFWREMIEEFGYPFIKRELLFSNPSGVPNLSTMMALISDEDRDLLLSDIRALSRRAPPLPSLHRKRKRDVTI